MVFRKLYSKNVSDIQLRNDSIDDSAFKLDVQQDEVVYTLKKEEHINVNGAIPGTTIDKPHTIIKAQGEATFTKLVNTKESTIYDGVTFTGDSLLVSVTNGTVIFNNCVFMRGYASDATIPFAQVSQGAYASFVGCRFQSDRDDEVMNGAGFVVLNDALNPVTNVSVVGGSNHTTWTNSNTTDLGIV